MSGPITRKYLDDEAFHREYLRDHPERETSPWVIGMAAAAAIGGGLLAYRKGAFRPIAEQAITAMGKYRNTKMGAAVDGLRNWTKRGKVQGTFKYRMELLRLDIKASKEAHSLRMGRMKGKPFITEREGSLQYLVTERNKALRSLDDTWASMEESTRKKIEKQYNFQNAKESWKLDIEKKMNDVIKQKNTVTAAEQASHVKQTGFRYATLEEAMPHLPEKQQQIFQSAMMDFEKQYGKGFTEEFMGKVYDKQLLINNRTGEFADLRDFHAMTTGFLDTVADDFTIPFAKLNPIRMLHLNKFSNINPAPTFHVLRGNTRQPALTKNVDALGVDHIFIDGNVFSTSSIDDLVAENVRLVNGKAGPVARYYRNLTGLTTSKYSAPKEGDFWGRLKWEVGNTLKLGFQDEPIGRDISWNYQLGDNSIEFPVFSDPLTWPAYMANKAHKKLKPYDSVKRIRLEDAFGKDADWIVFNNYKNVEQAGGFLNYTKQFKAGRKDLENVTTATLFPYGLFERINSTLNQVGLGLPNESLGSTFDIFKNLLLYRVAPVWLGVEAWQYLNYESDNFFGFQFEDKIADFYVGASVDAATLRDKLGVTDWAKHTAHLFPGGDHISELPAVGKLFKLNMSEEETREYWESGYDPVRKGRYWEYGNTPFTGGKIEYFEPNWARRTKSDYEFTDSQWGSREEYFQNHILPTPRHPFAPIRALITNPYHWEEKHYYSRPYMMTGGVTALEDIPLVGAPLNATVGQIIKPAKQMHIEYWESERPDGMYAKNVAGKLVGPVFEEEQQGIYADPIYMRAQAALGQNELYRRDTRGTTYEVSVAEGVEGAISGNQVLVREAPSEEFAIYTTPSGSMTPVKVPQDEWTSVESLNRAIKQKALSRANSEVETIDRVREGIEIEYPAVQLTGPTDAAHLAGNFYSNLTGLAGAYGFYTNTVIGEYQAPPEIATSTEWQSSHRKFWDMNIGNLGGDANEIFRRFVPRDGDRGQRYNPVRNQMPSWLPGDDYFINFQTGDPYTKVTRGEMRLPGAGYEALHDIEINDELRIGASHLGKSIEEIRDQMLRRNEVMDDDGRFVTDTGEDWHSEWYEKEMMSRGIGLDYEQYVRVPEMGVGGFYDLKVDQARWLEYVMENADRFVYYGNTPDLKGADRYGGYFDEGTDILALRDRDPEAFKEWIQQTLNDGTMALVDPKTMSDYKYNQEEMFFMNVQQVNFYLHATGQKRGYLMHVNREETLDDSLDVGEESFQIYGFDYNPELLKYSYGRVEKAREHIEQGMIDGTYGRGDFYDMIDQYRILADVAPYSQEFQDMKRDIRNWTGLTKEHEQELRQIEDQVRQRKQNLRLEPYRFQTANVERMTVTVDEVIDNNMFVAKEFSNNPIRMAGIYVPTGKNDDRAKQAADVINLKKGQKVQIAIDPDPVNQVNNDTYRTIDAVLYKNNININMQLIEAGLAREKVDDFSPAAVHARFTRGEIGFGSLWEKFAHMDTPYHTKLLQVRSPLESYERREVYGKDWQDWKKPVSDFFVPWYQNIIRKEPILALAVGALLGSAFGNTRFGRISGALIGLSAAAVGVSYVGMYEEIKGDTWVPQRRKDEWEMIEYLDTLKYVKYRRLYEWAANEALREEGTDVRQMLAEKSSEADMRSAERSYLQKLKRDMKMRSGREYEEALSQAEAHLQNRSPYLLEEHEDNIERAINARLEEIGNDRELESVGEWTARALTYYNEAERTMYGYDPGEPLQNFLAALPKRDRDYLIPFMQAPEEERERILGVAPGYMKRVLQSSWGMEVDDKPDLEEYFLNRGLPEPDWIGWDDRASLDDVKVKMVRKEGLDKSDFNIWPQDELQASYANIEAPNLKEKNKKSQVRERLYDVLRGLGLEDIMVRVSDSKGDASTVYANIAVDRREEIIRRMNEDAVKLL